MSNSLWPQGLQHARLPCSSLSPEVCSYSCPLSRWCYLTISSILCHPLLLLPSIFPSIRVFSNESSLRIRWPKYWSFSFSINLFNEYSRLISFRIDRFDLVSASASVFSMNIQGWFPLGLIGLILQSKLLSRVISSTTIRKYQLFSTQPSLWSRSHGSQPCHGEGACITQWSYEPCGVGHPKTDES